jgi:hypothetical protein
LQNYPDYIGLKDLWGVEWYNGAENHGYSETMQPIDDLLREGEHVFPIAADDSHGSKDYPGFPGPVHKQFLNPVPERGPAMGGGKMQNHKGGQGTQNRTDKNTKTHIQHLFFDV